MRPDWPHQFLIFALVALAAPAASFANPQDARSDARIREAALWRAAALQLDVIGGQRSQVSRAEALAQAVAGWRARPGSIDVEAEIAALTPRAKVYLSPTWAPGAARWPSDEPPGVYALVAERELSAARTDFAYASAAGTSPGEALARAAKVYAWAQGRKDGPTDFAQLHRDVDAAMAITARAIDGVRADAVPAPPALPPSPAPLPPARIAPPPARAEMGTATPPGTVSSPLSLTWIGFGADRVGVRGPARDGQADAEFEIRYARGGQIVQMVNLAMATPTGELCCQTWSTASQQFHFLGVAAPGASTLGNSMGFSAQLGYAPEALRIYAPSSEWFAPGSRVVATVVFADGTYVAGSTVLGGVQPVPLPVQAAGAAPGKGTSDLVYALGLLAGQVISDRTRRGQPAPPFAPGYPPPGQGSGAPGPGAGAATGMPGQITLHWAGMARDEVAPGSGASADGKADAAFLLDASRVASAIVTIELYDSDAQGQPKGNRWSTRGGGYWMLGVTTGAGRVNGTGYMDNLNLAPQALTIFAAEPGQAFVRGRYFAVEVSLADGRRVIAVAMVQ